MSHNKILALILGMVTILLMGCVETLDFTPVPTATATVVPTNTPEPIPTETPTDTPTPSEEIILPAGCLSWLVDADYNFSAFLCEEDNPQLVEMTAGRCMFLADEAQGKMAIHYKVVNLDDTSDAVIAEPGKGAICIFFDDVLEVWAEPLEAYEAKECFGTLDLVDGNGSVPLCSYPTEIGLYPNDCFVVNTREPVNIFYTQPTSPLDDVMNTLLKNPGEKLCNATHDILNTGVWAELAAE